MEHSLAGEILPADLLTKALAPPRFQALLPLMGVVTQGKPGVSKVYPKDALQQRRVALGLWLMSVPQMLKGCQGESQGDDGSQMIWILMAVMSVVLLWEGVKTAVRPCFNLETSASRNVLLSCASQCQCWHSVREQ